MSGLYLLLVAGIWAGLTALFAKGWRRWRAGEGANRRTVDVICLLVLSLWLGVSFWYGGGRKIYYDTLVNRMCREDGGVKVYETVKLPPDRFDKWGMVTPYDPTRKENALGPDYIVKWNVQHYRDGEPSMRRDHFQVIRQSDLKLLGEAISYSRRGGDIPGPWHPSSLRCPDQADDVMLIKQVFIHSN